MSNKANTDFRFQTIEKTCLTANIVYLLLRVFYLVLFIISQAYILVGITAGTILIYSLFFLLIKKKKYYLYALLCGNEFFAFISVTTVMLGFSTGFHFYLIGLCVVSFFTSYFSNRRDTKGSIVWVGLSLIIYLTLYLVSVFNAPYYVIDKWVEVTLFIVNAIVVFGFIASYLLVFLKYAFLLEKKIIHESRTDELTQIKNRYGLYDYYDSIEDKSNSVLALFDIDDFKLINDKYGHVTGDFILKKVATIAKETLKDSFVCRFGGEEFVIVLQDDENNPALDRLEILRAGIEKEIFEFEGTMVKITITVGAVKYSNEPSLEKWVDDADEKMYQGKATGKNKIVY